MYTQKPESGKLSRTTVKKEKKRKKVHLVWKLNFLRGKVEKVIEKFSYSTENQFMWEEGLGFPWNAEILFPCNIPIKASDINMMALLD